MWSASNEIVTGVGERQILLGDPSGNPLEPSGNPLEPFEPNAPQAGACGAQ